MSLLRCTVALLVGFTATFGGELDPATAPSAKTDVLEKYLSAIQAQKDNPVSVSMEADFDAQVPRLKKHGRWHAFRFISKLGKIRYLWQGFEGDNMIKKDVIGRYLTLEAEAQNGYARSLAITPDNYRLRYKETVDYAGRTAYVFQVSPKKKQLGLYKGELWIDGETYLPLRQWGELVKNPSIFLRNIYFVNDYSIFQGISVPRRLISDVDTRLVGKAKLTIWYDNYRVGEETQVSSLGSGGSAAMGGEGAQLH